VLKLSAISSRSHCGFAWLTYLGAGFLRRVTYGELIGGKRFNVTLTGKNTDTTTGVAQLKPVQELKHVGQSPQRFDIPAKVDGSLKWAVDVKLPGMVHARNVKPPFAGATLTSVDESSVRDIPGFVQIVRRGNYLAVVCEREEQAIRAARQLKAQWQRPTTAPFPTSENLFNYMRSATPTFSSPPSIVGTPDVALKAAAKTVAAEYEVPFQGHASLGPAHATADPSNDQMTIYSNDMKSYGLRDGVAEFLQMPRDRVRVIWLEGSQAYGRTAADDAGFEAAFLAREIKRPVRLQWMRDEETGWDTKAPAFVVSMRGGLDAQGTLVAYDYEARAADHNHLGYNEPDTVLIAQLANMRKATPNRGSASTPSDMYVVPNRRMAMHVVGLPLVWETPLRTGNLRDPNGPQATFASESFIDELAAAAGADPVAFRMKLLTGSTNDDSGFKRARSIAVLKAAAEAYGWEPRVSPKPIGSGEVLTGRGIAYAYRSQTVVAEIAEVEVNRRTGRVWVKRLVCAHDCGLVVNPSGVRASVEHYTLKPIRRPSLAEGFIIDAYPLCNPTGYEDATRCTRGGKDLNREFWSDSKELEVRLLEKELKGHHFQGIVSLHCDDTSHGLYGFLSGRQPSEVLSASLLEPALRAGEEFLPRNHDQQIDGFHAHAGILSSCYDGVLRAPDGLAQPPFEITFETPQLAPVALQIEAFTAALLTILVEYRQLLAHAPNL
jgi:CO/xanthine dehydrogenase Mo-binding subunit